MREVALTDLSYLVSLQAVLTNVEIAEFTKTWARFDPLGTDYIPAMKGTSAASQSGCSPSFPPSCLHLSVSCGLPRLHSRLQSFGCWKSCRHPWVSLTRCHTRNARRRAGITSQARVRARPTPSRTTMPKWQARRTRP